MCRNNRTWTRLICIGLFIHQLGISSQVTEPTWPDCTFPSEALHICRYTVLNGLHTLLLKTKAISKASAFTENLRDTSGNEMHFLLGHSSMFSGLPLLWSTSEIPNVSFWRKFYCSAIFVHRISITVSECLPIYDRETCKKYLKAREKKIRFLLVRHNQSRAVCVCVCECECVHPCTTTYIWRSTFGI